MRGLKENACGGDIHTYIQHTYNIRTDIATIRLNRPLGRFSENGLEPILSAYEYEFIIYEKYLVTHFSLCYYSCF